MAINFPENPIAGNTYEYLDIQYIYRVSGNVGWWAVNTPAFVGVATPDEINAGTNNEKYTTPQGLNSSKYVREDETTGETVLSDTGDERLRAHRTGVDVTGSLSVGGVNMITYITETGSSINNGRWRKWSDGTIEQWGTSTSTNDPAGAITTFPIEHPDTAGLSITVCPDSSTAANTEMSIFEVTTTSFKTITPFLGGRFIRWRSIYAPA